MPTDAAPPGLRLLVADRYRVDARLLVPGARVDAVDLHASAARRVRVACVELDGPTDSAAARLDAWAAAHGAGLPVCEPLHALDDDPGPLLVLAAPPDGPVHGDPASLAAQARVLAGALAERGLRAGQIGALDLALAADGTLVLTAPPPVAAVVDPRAEADRLASAVAALAGRAAPAGAGASDRPAATSPRAGGGLPRLRATGRRGVVRAATLVAAAAAVLVLAVGPPLGGGGPAEPEGIPVAEEQTPPPATATVPDLPPLTPALQEASGDEPAPASPSRPARRAKRPAAARPGAGRPKAGARRKADERHEADAHPKPARRRVPSRSVPRPVLPAPTASPPPRRWTPPARPAPSTRPAPRWALGPDAALGPHR